jgi:hypothetical protein
MPRCADLREGLHDLLNDWEEAAASTNAVFTAWIEAGMSDEDVRPCADRLTDYIRSTLSAHLKLI